MMSGTQIWLRLASVLMPDAKSDWLRAMQAELSAIPDPRDRNAFAFGCFMTAMKSFAHTRKGLNYLARAGGAFVMTCLCIAGLIYSAQIWDVPETHAIAKLLTGLLAFYMIGACLLIVSVKGLKMYAAAGFSLAASGWAYCTVAKPEFETMPIEFLCALGIEAAGVMVGLFIAAIFLNLLYSPEENYA